MAYTPIDGTADAGAASFPMTTLITHEVGDGVVLDIDTGYTIVPATGDNRIFLGVANENKTNAGASGTETIQVATGQQILQNRTIVGTGASGTLAVTDLGKDVFITAARTFTVVDVANGVKCGRLVKIRSAGTSSDGKGDIYFAGIASTNIVPQAAIAAPTDLAAAIVAINAIRAALTANGITL